MNILQSTLPKILLAMLAALSMVFFVEPQKEVEAQRGASIAYFCFNPTNGQTMKTAANADGVANCPAAPWIGRSAPTGEVGICVYQVSQSYEFIKVQLDVNGQPRLSGTKCLNSNGDVFESTYRAFSTMVAYTGGTTPPTNTPPTNTPPTNTPPTNTPGGGNANLPGPNPQNQGSCETGFHEVGPLCVPNSPFNNGESITGQNTVAGLATRIIRILLYFAAIVAVIMAIVGGYQVMTAGGNQIQAINGRKTLTNAIIGLVIIILSYVIIQAVINFVT